MQSIKIVPEQVEDATSNIRLSNIRKILVNGRKSELAFQKYIKTVTLDCNYKYVSSSSSANTSLSLLEKVEYWRKAILD